MTGDRELELAGEFGLPAWLGVTAKLSARFKTTWQRRTQQYVASVSEYSGFDEEALEEACIQDERRGDLFAAGGERATRVADPLYRAALGTLVGTAMRDRATVSETDRLAHTILKLEPLDLRVLLLGVFDAPDEEENPERLLSGGMRRPTVLNVKLVASARQISRAAAEGVLETLANCGFLILNRDNEALRITRYIEGGDSRGLPREWLVTDWGQRAIDLCRGTQHYDTTKSELFHFD